jgi:NAD(P)-dependent dehydrogenase (short-subunit alcohol dehydrogenase family)
VDSTAYTRNVLLNSAAAQVLGQFFLRAIADLNCDQHLVMISSGAAQRPYEGESSYCAGKAAMDQWVRVVGREQERRAAGCRVVAIAPGTVDTAMQDEIRATDTHAFPEAQRFRELWHKGGLSRPHEVARAIWSSLDRTLDNGAVLHVRDLL